MLRLGGVVLDQPFFQAALSGYSDQAMRTLAREFGAPMTFAGQILARIALHPPALQKPIFIPGDDEHPIGAQVLGREPVVMARAAKLLVEIGYDLIDLNFACPARKVLRRGRGGALLDEPEDALTIFRHVREAVTCPVLMKLRIGMDSNAASRDKFFLICERAAAEGVDGLIVHGRTVKQAYRGRADWSVLSELKRRCPRTPLIGSGDLLTAQQAADRLASGEVDGVAIARGAIGNPWIFRELSALLARCPRPGPPSQAQLDKVIRDHQQGLIRLYGTRKAKLIFRKFISGYARHHPRRKAFQAALMADDGSEVDEKAFPG